MAEHAVARPLPVASRSRAGISVASASMTSHITADRAALVFCCERACLGRSHPGLLQRLGPDLMAALMRRFLDCAIEDLAQWPGHRIVVAPQEDAEWASTLPPPVTWMPVPSLGHFGERIWQVDRAILDRGIRHRIFMRAGVPSLSSSDYDAALAGLDSHDVVVGPVAGGGVGLIALRHPWPQIVFLPWSTTTIRSRLLIECSKRAWMVRELRAHYGLQRGDDLRLIQSALTGDERTARADLRRFIGALLGETG